MIIYYYRWNINSFFPTLFFHRPIQIHFKTIRHTLLSSKNSTLYAFYFFFFFFSFCFPFPWTLFIILILMCFPLLFLNSDSILWTTTMRWHKRSDITDALIVHHVFINFMLSFVYRKLVDSRSFAFQVVVHKNDPKGMHFRRAGPRQKVGFTEWMSRI